MHENERCTHFKICDTLQPREKCFRVQTYHEGQFAEVFHEHIPMHRFSTDRAIEALKALTIHHSDLTASSILHSYMNKMGKNPPAEPLFNIVSEYPEPGVLRRYCSGHATHAWMDEVIDRRKFRSASSGTPASTADRS